MWLYAHNYFKYLVNFTSDLIRCAQPWQEVLTLTQLMFKEMRSLRRRVDEVAAAQNDHRAGLVSTSHNFLWLYDRNYFNYFGNFTSVISFDACSLVTRTRAWRATPTRNRRWSPAVRMFGVILMWFFT